MPSRLEAVLRAGEARRRSVPTGEFVTLSGEEAAALRAKGETDPVTLNEYVASDELPAGESWFRVRFRLMKADRTYKYKLYSATVMWEWVQRQLRNDARTLFLELDRSGPMWREDWIALHNRYDPQGVVPADVWQLPQLNDPQDVYEGIGNHRRKVRTEYPGTQGWAYYEGAPGQETKVKRDFPSGEVDYFEGIWGKELKVRTEYPNGLVVRYGGWIPENEPIVRIDLPDGRVRHYDGHHDSFARLEYPDGTMRYYDEYDADFPDDWPEDEEYHDTEQWHADHVEPYNDTGEEFLPEKLKPNTEIHLVRIEFPDGHVMHFSGDRGKERIVRTVLRSGRVVYYDGDQGYERRVRSEYPDGEVKYFEGDKGEERLVRVEKPVIVIEHYEGAKGEEHKVRVEGLSGTHYYEGARHHERRVRTEWDAEEEEEEEQPAARRERYESDGMKAARWLKSRGV